MSTFYYNGITISPVHTEACRRRAIYDGPTYLYTRWVIRIRGLFNPAATSFTTVGGDPRFGGNPSQPENSQGFNPAWTDNSVRLMLMQPRGSLLYTASGPNDQGGADFGLGTDLTILSLNDSTISTIGSDNTTITDANNGPFPLDCTIRRISGTATFNVDFTIQCDINECYRVYSEPAFVLSNRWQMTHDVNEHAFTVRYVQGRAIFRTDVMLQQNIRPDDYRAAFFFPVPENFKRQNIKVSVPPDGNECHYSFADVEQSHNILAENVTRIEAWANVSMSQGSAEQYAVGMAKVAKKAAIHALREASRAPGAIPGEGEIRGSAAGAAIAAIETVAGAIEVTGALLPRGTVTVNVRIWGNRKTTRKYLESVAAKIILIKLPQIDQALGVAIPGLGRVLYGVDASNTYDLMGRYVEASMTLNCGPITSFLTAPGAILHGMSARFPELLEDDIGDVATVADRPGYAMPSDAGARGTYIENCVAAALQNICGNPFDSVLVAKAPIGANTLRVPPGSTTITSETLPTTATGNAPLNEPVGIPSIGSGGQSTLVSR